jgi:shikimate kinase
MVNKVVAPKDRKIIALVGIMGVGKTTIGRRLAQRLDINFTDSDKEIESVCKKKVSDIFKDSGEESFRETEREVIKEIIDRDKPLVLSLGGGSFIDDETRDLIKKKCVCIWLNADLDVILERIGDKTNRPLLNGVNKEEVLAKLIKERTPLYSECDIKINSDQGGHRQTVDNIIKELKNIL